MSEPHPVGPDLSERQRAQIRLFLEEICCEICRFEHVERDGVAPERIQIRRELALGAPGSFADIEVEAPGVAPYFVEVKYGYPAERLVRHLARKYGTPTPRIQRGAKVVLVLASAHYLDWPALRARLEGAVGGGLALEIWDESDLRQRVRERFGVELSGMMLDQHAEELRAAIDKAKWRSAFGQRWEGSTLQASLLWHFGFWRLRQLHTDRGLEPAQVLPPGRYQNVAIVLADLCAYSSYVRDTRESEVVRDALTTFYSNARFAVLNSGGMLVGFVGDEVVGRFGAPERHEGYVERALECARSLVEIGNSVSNKWQRQIDRVQSAGGVHVGIGIGDLEIVPLRPFSRNHMGVIGDAINMAARLTHTAGPSEVVVSNTFFHELDELSQAGFEEIAPVEAHNVGLIKCWRLCLGSS
jgi:class 3 adenylate cyclase